jgi:hypothetical protein
MGQLLTTQQDRLLDKFVSMRTAALLAWDAGGLSLRRPDSAAQNRRGRAVHAAVKTLRQTALSRTVSQPRQQQRKKSRLTKGHR